MATYVTLNVGGKQYMTKKSTLLRYPGSYFMRLFDENVPPTKNEEGHYLIDRDGEIFCHVLNFLRRGSLVLPVGFNEYDALKCEADFYLLDELEKVVKEQKIGLRVGRKIFRMTTEEGPKQQTFPANRYSIGDLVIDTEKGVFKLVIKYLQSGGIFFKTTPEQLDSLKKEAEYFGLPMLAHHLETVRFMQEMQGSSSVFLHIFCHEKGEDKDCVVYANKDRLHKGNLLSLFIRFDLSSICDSYPRYGYNSRDCMFAGLTRPQMEKIRQTPLGETPERYAWERMPVRFTIWKHTDLKIRNEDQLIDGWKKIMFSLP